MSGIIQSFFIQPVIRQARRFTATAPESEKSRLRTVSLSHVSDQQHAQHQQGPRQHQQQARFDPDASSASAIFTAGGHDQPYNATPVYHPSAPPLSPTPADTIPHRASSEEPVERGRPRSRDDAAMDDTAIDMDPDEELVLSAAAAYRTPDRLRSTTDTVSVRTSSSSSRSSRADSSAAGSPSPRTRRHTARRMPRTSRERPSSAPKTASSLPANDGMAGLRHKIIAIQQMDESPEQKARLMHVVMTEDFYTAHANMRPTSPASLLSQEVVYGGSPTSPRSPDPRAAQDVQSSPHSPTLAPINPYNTSAEDFILSFRPPTPLEPIGHLQEEPETPAPVLGCPHYKRFVKVQCFDCKKWYPCRHCHDEADASHTLNRQKTESMLCMLCATPQPAGQYCSNCGHRAACYYCDICRLWDDDATKSIYHCNDCGICRRGEGLGKDFVHCKKCNVCITISHATTHHCIERAIDCDCPICGDYMFTSLSDIVAMPCGHYLHHACYTEYVKSAYKCPMCKKSCMNMELQWRKLEQEIERQPMPLGLRGQRMEVKCNDCSARSVVPFHWLGCKCGSCDGFNTTELKLVADAGTRRDLDHFVASERRAQQRSRALSVPQPTDYFASGTTTAAVVEELAADSPGLAERLAELRPNLPNLPFVNPYEMLARVSRSLPPIRQYFNDDGDAAQQPGGLDGAQDRDEHDGRSETLSLWGDGAWFFSSGGEEDEDGEIDGSDDGSDEDNLNLEDDDEDESGSDEGGLDLRLAGHI